MSLFSLPLFRWLLAVHIIAVISWMAGILYLIRLFVYHAAETENIVKLRFTVMERRLYQFITLPAMCAATGLGFVMVAMNPGLMRESWMQLKLALAVALIFITVRAGRYIGQFEAKSVTRGHQFFRILNEIPTLIMILIVFLVILRPALTP